MHASWFEQDGQQHDLASVVPGRSCPSGPGNWAAASEHVGTKTAEECLQHYFQIYIEPDSCPLPTPALEMTGVSTASGDALQDYG